MRWKTSWQTSGRASELRVRYEAFLEEHQADYRKLYDRVDVDLGEDLSASLPTSRRLAYGAGVWMIPHFTGSISSIPAISSSPVPGRTARR